MGYGYASAYRISPPVEIVHWAPPAPSNTSKEGRWDRIEKDLKKSENKNIWCVIRPRGAIQVAVFPGEIKCLFGEVFILDNYFQDFWP